MKILGRVLYLSTIVVILVSTTEAQYFGRNKIQYENFDFHKMKSKEFEVHFYPSESLAVYDATRMLERWYTRLVNVFQESLEIDQPVILYANHADFQQTNVISGMIPQGTGGVTEGMRQRIVIPLTGVYAENDHVLGHELVHSWHYQIMKASPQGIQAGSRIPLWFIEGMSEYLSIGSVAPLTAMWMRDAVLHDDLPPIKTINVNYKYFPYRYGHAIWAYMAGRWGDDIIAPLYQSVLVKGWKQGVMDVLGISVDSLSSDWQVAMREQFTPPEGTQKPKEVGKRIIGDNSQTNLSPVISPDGRYIAFISNRDLFTLDLYLADAKTGKVIKKLVTSNTDEHFDALRFMNSSGTWSPDAKTLAFPVFKKGDNHVTFLDVEKQKVKRTVKIDPVDAISYLSWSPDGKKLLVSGTKGAVNDLYIYDIESEESIQLTNDRYAELQPTWSPDGKSIAFVTDRGPKTDFDSLRFGPMNIGFYDFENKVVRVLSMAQKAKHICPQFSPDGRSIYFISDPDGISNLYRYDLRKGHFYRITNVATGVSGLTELSPAFSLASETGELIVSIFEKTDHRIYRISADSAAGTLYNPAGADYLATTEFSPKEPLVTNIVDKYLENASAPKLDPEHFSVSDYVPNMDLLYVGQAFVGASVSSYGSGIAGGLSMLFSDLLGNHKLGVAAQVSGSIEDLGGQIQYLNQANRINWGFGAGHFSYLTADSLYGPDPQADNTDEYTYILERTFVDRLNLMADYPFSANRRLEVGLGATRYSFQKSARILSVENGIIVGSDDEDRNDPDALNQFYGAVAYVGDYSSMGFTGPVNGRRFRIEAEPTFGTLRYASLLADYRHYFFLRPVTFALRVLHYGRYLKDAENERLSPLTIGYETLVRGYNVYNSTINGSIEDTPRLNRLYGSRVGVFNAEVRVPLLGVDQFGLINFQYLPTTLLAFFDAGVAWNKGDYPVLKYESDTDERVPVFSTGLGARVNLLGVLVLQFSYSYPFQRPNKGAHFSFAIAPGW